LHVRRDVETDDGPIEHGIRLHSTKVQSQRGARALVLCGAQCEAVAAGGRRPAALCRSARAHGGQRSLSTSVLGADREVVGRTPIQVGGCRAVVVPRRVERWIKADLLALPEVAVGDRSDGRTNIELRDRAIHGAVVRSKPIQQNCVPAPNVDIQRADRVRAVRE
jgi:hypothetical protein